MEEKRERPNLAMSPSFGEEVEDDDCIISTVDLESPQHISAVYRNQQEAAAEEGGGEESGDDFEFALVTRDFEIGDSITADEIVSNGRILPVYPVFNRDLLLGGDTAAEEKADPEVRIALRRMMIEDRVGRSSSTSSSEADEIEGIAAAGSYCVWAPQSVPQSPERCRKSSSTGSLSRWRLRDLVVGRSHSDGKEKFVFLGNPSPNPNSKGKSAAVPKEEEKGKNGMKVKGGKVKEMDMVTAHRMFYAKGGAAAAVKGGRRSFLPYRQQLVGFFASGNGLSRSHHPF